MSDDCFYGLYRGKVISNQDPENQNRIQAIVPDLFGDAPLPWATPCYPPGWNQNLLQAHPAQSLPDPQGGAVTLPQQAHALALQLPRPGRDVWIAFEAGDKDHPIWMGVWLGG